MSKKQITELESADSIDDGDLILVRKSGQGVDRKLTKDKLVESLGSAGINGYTAVSTTDNKIDLTPSNGAGINAYADGMRVSFISPIESDGVVEIKIGTLPYVELQKYNTAETVELTAGEYVEAVYTDNKFKQTNNVNTNLVWSNDYTATGTVEKPGALSFTKYELTSAIGTTKPQYYNGMTALFTVPIDSEGLPSINIDGLDEVFMQNTYGGQLSTPKLYKNQLVMAVYDGQYFNTHQFASVEQPLPVAEYTEEELEEIASQPEYTEEDEPAAAISPDAIDSRGHSIFDNTIKVGASEEHKNISNAVNALRRIYGNDGGGRNIAILLTDYSAPPTEIIGEYENKEIELDWISIFAENNKLINFNNSFFHLLCTKTPIFNFKINALQNLESLQKHLSTFVLLRNGVLSLGKNFECTVNADNVTVETHSAIFTYEQRGFGESTIRAKHGYKISTNLLLSSNEGFILDLHHGEINLFQKPAGVTILWLGQSIYVGECDGGSVITDTVINSTLTNDVVLHIVGQTTLENVRSTDRTGTRVGVVALGNAASDSLSMKDCQFASSTSGEPTSGYDIVLDGNSETRIFLDNTTGNTDREVGVETSRGKIVQNS